MEIQPPAFQFYCKDWLTSEKVHAMSDRAFRAYVNLLAQAWLSRPIGSLPDDDRLLASMSRLGRQAWKSVEKEVRSCFEKRENRLVSTKLETQARGLSKYHLSKSLAGKVGAIKRWKRLDNQSRLNGTAIHLPLANNSSSSSSSSSKKEENKEAFAIPVDLLESESEIRDWLEYKKQKGQTYKPGKGIEALWRKFRAIPREQRRISVDHCMANNWSGLFEKKLFNQKEPVEQKKEFVI